MAMLPEGFSEKFDALIEDVKVIKSKVAKIDELAEGVSNLQLENEDLKIRISTLEDEKIEINTRLNESEQYSRRENLIITGVPKEPNENIRAVVTRVAEKLGVKLYKYDVCDVCIAHRLSNKGEAPAIVVKMNNRDKKIKMISEGKKKVLSAMEIGGKTDTRIFISEHLTKETSELLAATKEKLRDPGFVKFVWPSDGHVLIWEDERSRVIRITDRKHLQELEEALHEDNQRQDQPSETDDVEEMEDATIENEEESRTVRNKKGNSNEIPPMSANKRNVKKVYPKKQSTITNYVLRNQSLNNGSKK